MKSRIVAGAALVVSCLLTGSGIARADVLAQSGRASDIQPRGIHHVRQAAKPGGSSRVGTNGIGYHGGSVMTAGPNVYYIWYGNWTGTCAGASGSAVDTSANSVLTYLAQHEGGSPYFNINTTYYNGSGAHVANTVTYKAYTTDCYSQGTSFGDSGVWNIVTSAISSGRLPADSNGVYFVLTTSDVSETSGFLTQYCGWHTHGTLTNGMDVKYSFVGDPANGMSACAAQTTSPNNDAPADAMASVIAHELEEATTDPDLNAWYDNRGQENADKCAWTFGTESTATNGSKFNVTFGTKQYLIQQNWVNASGGYCSMSY